ncbi:creatinine amidohydrolase [Sulfurimicrobium lacus]|uniref:Creatinine amidohydrolase n=1 Tax=Sulfurimicrobium lacus TaxID=2715678 RepID=A0A6F8V930_9PROT|nr:creatininase family protein [Sulfurimicrobium lacus]BCB25279.1 creatinine amidohydrolase [Sulfurimicrobium lacus]
MKPVLWQELTWEDVAALRDQGITMAILPVGATEQHGPHLPLGVDTLSAEAVALGASAATGIPVLPTLAYGCSLGHSPKWPGTISLRPETLSRLVLEIAEWLQAAGFERLLILNGHVTNWAPLRCGLENIRHTYPHMRVALRSLWDVAPEARRQYHADAENFHANCAETSLMLSLRPDLVRMDKAVDEPDRSAHCFFAYQVCDESRHGVVGSPSGATPAQGASLLQQCVTALSAQLKAALTEKTPLETQP